MNRPGQPLGLAFVVSAVTVTITIGYICRRDDPLPPNPNSPPPAAAATFRIRWASLVRSGDDPKELPKGICPELLPWVASWSDLRVSDVRAPNQDLDVFAQSSGAHPVEVRHFWAGQDLYVVLLKGYGRAPQRTSLALSTSGRTHELLVLTPLPSLPDSYRTPAPKISPPWPGVEVYKCDRPPISLQVGNVRAAAIALNAPDGPPFAICVTSNLPKGHALIAQPYGSTDFPDEPDRKLGYVVGDAAKPKARAEVFHPMFRTARVPAADYLLLTEVEPKSRVVTLTFPTSDCIRRFGEVWFPKHVHAMVKGSDWKIDLLAVDLVPIRKPVKKRRHIGFILYTDSGIRSAGPVDLRDDELLGRMEIRSVAPTLIDGQGLVFLNSFRAYDGLASAAYPTPESFSIGENGTPMPTFPITESTRFPTSAGRLGDQVKVTIQMDFFKIVRQELVSIDLSGKARPLPAGYREAPLVSGPAY